MIGRLRSVDLKRWQPGNTTNNKGTCGLRPGLRDNGIKEALWRYAARGTREASFYFPLSLARSLFLLAAEI